MINKSLYSWSIIENYKSCKYRSEIPIEIYDACCRCQLSTLIKRGYFNSEYRNVLLRFFLRYRINLYFKIRDIYKFEDYNECLLKEPELLPCIPTDLPFYLDLIKPYLNSNIYDYLPNEIARLPEVKQICNRNRKVYENDGLDKEGYDNNWINENGEIIQYFSLKDNFPITKKEDYYRIFKEYILSGLSVQKFCEKFKISPVDGFEKMLVRIEDESLSDKEDIDNTKAAASKKFFAGAINTFNSIADGSLSFKEFIENGNYNYTLLNAGLAFRTCSDDTRNKLAKIILDYYMNSPYLVHQNFILFISNSKMKPSEMMTTYIRRDLRMPEDREYIINFKNTLSDLNGHSKYFDRSYSMMAYLDKNGNKVEVTNDMVDQAYIYLRNNNYYRSNKSMNYIIKKIVRGELDLSEEVIVEKEEIIDLISDKLKQIQSIEEYIDVMNNDVKSL